MIGDRIKSERERLGMTQPDFAAAAGAAKRTLIEWEKGATSPTALQLSALLDIGVDAQYILTGQRSANALLPADESLLLDGFRASSPETRKAALRVLLGGDLPAPVKTKTKTIKVTGDGNQAAGRDLIHQQGVEIEGSKPAGRRKR